MISSQRKRFATWLNLAPPQTRYLASCVELVLAPTVERLGFVLAGDPRLLPDQPVLGRELAFERPSGEFVDTLTFNFDKYRRPRFQIHVARRAASPPYVFLRSCNLVANAKQYLYFWGKPWWYPTAWWSHNRTDRLIESINRRLPQVDEFLDCAAIGPNISKRPYLIDPSVALSCT